MRKHCLAALVMSVILSSFAVTRACPQPSQDSLILIAVGGFLADSLADDTVVVDAHALCSEGLPCQDGRGPLWSAEELATLLTDLKAPVHFGALRNSAFDRCCVSVLVEIGLPSKIDSENATMDVTYNRMYEIRRTRLFLARMSGTWRVVEERRLSIT